jgi:hypothetical protein
MNALRFLEKLRGPRPLLVGLRLTLRGRVVEDRALLCTDTIRIGEGPGAKVAFPGGDLFLVPWGPELGIGTERLPPGATRVFDFGPVRVEIAHLERGRRLGRAFRAGVSDAFDLPYLGVVVAVVALSTWWDGRGVALVAPHLAAFLRAVASVVRSLPSR